MESLEEWADRYGLKATDPRDQAAVDELLDRASVVLDSATPSACLAAFTKAKATGSPRPQTVLVEVQGGFAEVTATPCGLATVIVDWDLIRTEGNAYLRSVIAQVKGSSLEEAEKARLIVALQERIVA